MLNDRSRIKRVVVYQSSVKGTRAPMWEFQRSIKYISSRVYALKNMNGFPFYPMRTLGKNTRENFVSKNSSLIVHAQLLFSFKRGACLSLVKARDGFETRRHLFSRSRFFFFFFFGFFFSVKGEFFGRDLWGCSGRGLGQ